jgi:hypothetical protein
MELPWVEIIQNSGPLSCVILFFLWRDWQREKLRAEEDKKHQEYHRTTQEENQQKMTAALVQTAECIRWMGQILDRLMQAYPSLEQTTRDLQRPGALHDRN